MPIITHGPGAVADFRVAIICSFPATCDDFATDRHRDLWQRADKIWSLVRIDWSARGVGVGYVETLLLCS